MTPLAAARPVLRCMHRAYGTAQSTFWYLIQSASSTCKKRSRAKDCSPGLWDTSAAGHLASGGSSAAAAKRELSEELRVSPHPVLDPVFKLGASPATGFEFVNVFRCMTAAPVIADPDEITEGCWVERGSLALWMRRDRAEFTATFHEICARLIW